LECHTRRGRNLTREEGERKKDSKAEEPQQQKEERKQVFIRKQ